MTGDKGNGEGAGRRQGAEGREPEEGEGRRRGEGGRRQKEVKRVEADIAGCERRQEGGKEGRRQEGGQEGTQTVNCTEGVKLRARCFVSTVFLTRTEMWNPVSSSALPYARAAGSGFLRVAVLPLQVTRAKGSRATALTQGAFLRDLNLTSRPLSTALLGPSSLLRLRFHVAIS